MSDEPTLVKCLVWDLDNTLWRGTLLEDGEVRLSEEIREVIVELDARGILQSVSSKNDHDLAWARLEQLGLAEYFVLPQIGWGAKSDSLRRIASRLNFAYRSIAFIDDQPTERAEIEFHLPAVRCYPAERATELLGLPELSPATRTVDSSRRRQLYQAGFRREAERENFSGPDELFLRSLDLVMIIDRATEEELTRLEELTLRTSQMNSTGVHYDEAALRGLMADPDHEVLVVTMADSFGPHGAVGIVLVAKYYSAWHLKLLATSCRVVSFGVAAVILNWLTDQAAHAGAHLVADFRRTARNRMTAGAYRAAGFGEQVCQCRPALPEAPEGVQRLHMETSPQPGPTTMTLTTVDLVAHTSPIAPGDYRRPGADSPR